MTGLVERVARAICQHRAARACEYKGHDRCASGCIASRENLLSEHGEVGGQARAAIAAMREPTQAMYRAGDRCVDDQETLAPSSAWIWRAMIDAALAEKTNEAP